MKNLAIINFTIILFLFSCDNTIDKSNDSTKITMQGDWYRNEGNGDLLRLKITKTEVFSLSESKENFHLTRSIFQCKDDSFYLINEKNYNEISKYKLIKLTEDSLTFEQEGLLIHRFARMKN